MKQTQLQKLLPQGYFRVHMSFKKGIIKINTIKYICSKKDFSDLAFHDKKGFLCVFVPLWLI